MNSLLNAHPDFITGAAVSGPAGNPSQELYANLSVYEDVNGKASGSGYLGFLVGQIEGTATDVTVADAHNGSATLSGTWAEPSGANPKAAVGVFTVAGGKLSGIVKDTHGVTLASVPTGDITFGQMLLKTT